ncbi:sigma factor regulatory protein, FecR/PupR family [Bacteroides pyogenes F0041]|uniref:Sigma factor regulatory protein, FecR/PupR family n=3 Tax=Bacteroides pyogenes TaxID=310300 RepID=U2CN78_9BACE|nr:sigma factor regulatory protein, FecR/PupR family [Bacteroides pyogenes F0041]GAE21051.1 putative anti-sigma factor [Bacteroides pyogenes JCM 10003]SUV35053.1 Fe2+-dicitrate sensor, membrane component [Bacteroides pyogenes]
MAQYAFKDIEEFLHDDDFFQWARDGVSDNGFDIDCYKCQYPGCEDRIDLAIAVIRTMNVVEDYKPFSRRYKERSFANMMKKVQQQKLQNIHLEKFSFKWKQIAVYAATVAVLFLSTLGTYYFLSHSKAPSIDVSANNLDSLLSVSRIRVLLDGKEAVAIERSNAEIRLDEKGTVIVDERLMSTSKNDRVSVNQVVVPYGKRLKLILPDGTSLWINSGSSISYGSDFSSNRKLNVQGEVYLDVKPDKTHPFVVTTSNFRVFVTGTAFNITDYSGEDESSVVLVRGSVNVRVGDRKEICLRPSERLSVEDKNIRVSEVDVYRYICWKDDVMNFCGQPLSFVLKSLSRYYNTKIEIIGSLTEERCYGSLDLNCTIDEVLRSISETIPISFSRKGNIIYILSRKNKKE